MRSTGIGLVVLGVAIGVFFLVNAAVSTSSSADGSIVMPVSAAAAILTGVALLVYGGTGYRETKVTRPAVQGMHGKSMWW
jgi:hypothetical protein